MHINLRKKNLVIIGSILFAGGLQAASENKVVYDCTNAETISYIEQTTINLFAPSPITTPTEFKKAYIEEQQSRASSGNDESADCVSILSDGVIEQKWKDLVDDVKNTDLPFNPISMNGATLQTILDQIQQAVKDEVFKAAEEATSDVCKKLSVDYLEQKTLDVINKKYGLSAKKLQLSSLSQSAWDKTYEDLDQDIKMLIDQEELNDEVSSATKEKVRKVRKDLWQNF